ncbi:hypothetical protein [Halobacillus alkaliphilus]|nr:hypothetical protein [Halobacillus alkaliphilus]
MGRLLLIRRGSILFRREITLLRRPHLPFDRPSFKATLQQFSSLAAAPE